MNKDNGIRLNKYIADAGICSRRQADSLIEDGRVTIDGVVCENGMRVLPSMQVCIDGKEIAAPKEEKVYLAFNKPRGIVCTAEKKEKNNLIDYLNYPVRITYCGRLDKDSEGLLILTNDGDIINDMMRARNNHEKEYIVKVNKTIDDSFIKGMSEGVYLKELDITTRKCKIKKMSDKEFSIILTQGLNRQIRRMCENFDMKVTNLKRVRVMNIELGNLKTGSFRELTKEELTNLKIQLSNCKRRE